jgi:hypothetical protein
LESSLAWRPSSESDEAVSDATPPTESPDPTPSSESEDQVAEGAAPTSESSQDVSRGEIEPAGEGRSRGVARGLIAGGVLALGIVALVAAILVAVFANEGTTSAPAVGNLAFGVIDSFQRANSSDSLGRAESGQPWVAVVGKWGIVGGSAYVSNPSRNTNNLAVVDAHTGDMAVQVTLSKLAAGSGLIFRWQNEFNYWLVLASPQVASWAVERVDHGKVTTVGTLGLAPVGDGTTVAVRTKGTLIEVSINGELARSFVDPAPDPHQTWVGMAAFGRGAGRARWGYLTAIADSPTSVFGTPAPGAASSPAGTSSGSTPTSR